MNPLVAVIFGHLIYAENRSGRTLFGGAPILVAVIITTVTGASAKPPAEVCQAEDH